MEFISFTLDAFGIFNYGGLREMPQVSLEFVVLSFDEATLYACAFRELPAVIVCVGRGSPTRTRTREFVIA